MRVEKEKFSLIKYFKLKIFLNIICRQKYKLLAISTEIFQGLIFNKIKNVLGTASFVKVFIILNVSVIEDKFFSE